MGRVPWDEYLLSEVACELGLQLVPENWRCGMTSALALESLGLLNIAEVLCAPQAQFIFSLCFHLGAGIPGLSNNM